MESKHELLVNLGAKSVKAAWAQSKLIEQTTAVFPSFHIILSTE